MMHLAIYGLAQLDIVAPFQRGKLCGDLPVHKSDTAQSLDCPVVPQAFSGTTYKRLTCGYRVYKNAPLVDVWN